MKKIKSVNIPSDFDAVMLDLETLGTLPGCVIVSLGAVEFDTNTGKIGRRFYRTIKIQSALNVGLFVEGQTIEWWLKQSEEARAAILKDAVDIEVALCAFALWFNPNYTIWGNGLGFDVSILKMAFHAIKYPHPWKYDAERDVRTIVAENPELKNKAAFVGVRHEPIADCEHQIKYVVAILQWLRKPRQMRAKDPKTIKAK